MRFVLPLLKKIRKCTGFHYAKVAFVKEMVSVRCVPKLLPDITVYAMERGSYFASYNSLKQTRKPVLLIYCRMRSVNMESV